MIKFLFLFLMLALPQISYSQLDSLKRQYDEASNWKEEINALVDLAAYYRNSDTSRVREHIEKIFVLAKKHDDNKARYQGTTSLASFYTKTSRYDLAQETMKKAYTISLKMKDPETTSSVLGNLGVLKYYTNELDSAKYYLDTAYQIKKTIVDIDPSNLSRNLNSLAQISRQLNLFEDAIKYQMAALEIGKKSGNNSTYLRALSGLAGLYGDLEQEEKAFSTEMKLYIKATEYGDLEASGVAAKNLGMKYLDKGLMDSSIFYFNIAKKQFDEIGYIRGLSEVNISIGDWNFEKGDFNLSLDNYKESLEYAESINEERLKATCYKNMGLVYEEQRRYGKAETALLESLSLFEKIDYNWGITKCYEALSDLYERTKDWQKAFIFQEKYFTISDSLNSEKFNSEVKSLELKYETEIKDGKIERQKLIISGQQNRASVLRKYIILISLLGLSGVFIMFQRARRKRMISEKNMEIKNQKIEELKNDNKILALSSMIEGQEFERKRIAQDLHDGLGGILSTIKLQMKAVQKEVTKLEEINLLDQAEKLVESAYSEVRRISQDMMPGALVNLGLFAALEDLAYQVNEANELFVKPQWYSTEDHMSEKTKMVLYRIIQEAVTNALKHSKATKMLIQISEAEGFYLISIEDDGIGFKLQEVEHSGTVGIQSIKSRVEFLNGSLEIKTDLNQGTIYEIEVPFDHKLSD